MQVLTRAVEEFKWWEPWCETEITQVFKWYRRLKLQRLPLLRLQSAHPALSDDAWLQPTIQVEGPCPLLLRRPTPLKFPVLARAMLLRSEERPKK